ncbi:DUF3313 family protein [Brevundimonas sp. Root1279]|uniref:DUF3313 family protein n=1 Tax=Brevundimonas sp. Root1279 TaxID=1736443 RepID=UPI0006FB37B9|nr:DUF3313 family protein [Brevundimonas sp. Root1279]KQW79800.1 hypothetical protein ASC65_14740 [Brevundimonas sp. Root1279]
MPQKLLTAAMVTSLAGLAAACATAPASSPSGYLSSYAGLARRDDTVRASVHERRDDVLASGVQRLWIAPAEVFGVVHPVLSEGERQAVLAEVDRQVCYELSERFDIADQPGPDAASVRIGVTHIAPTNPAGSAAAAVANFFIPGPVTVRAPGGTGGLGAEAELLTADGRQAAAIVWRRDAMVIGTDSPSLSRVGDAHQLAEPLGDMVGDAFSTKDRKVRPIPTPDPCARFGPRVRAEGFLVRVATGLYQPELSGGPAASAQDDAVQD